MVNGSRHSSQVVHRDPAISHPCINLLCPKLRLAITSHIFQFMMISFGISHSLDSMVLHWFLHFCLKNFNDLGFDDSMSETNSIRASSNFSSFICQLIPSDVNVSCYLVEGNLFSMYSLVIQSWIPLSTGCNIFKQFMGTNILQESPHIRKLCHPIFLIILIRARMAYNSAVIRRLPILLLSDHSCKV